MTSGFMLGSSLSQIFDKGRDLRSSIVDKSKRVGNAVKTTANAAGEKWNESPTFVKAGVIGTTAAIAAPFAIIPLLGAVGFTSAGVAAGTIAASMQTATTVSGSIFALCQSAGAVGAVAASTSVGVGLAAGTTAGGITAAVCRRKHPSENGDPNGDDEAEEEQDIPGDGDEPAFSIEEQNE